MSGVLETNPLAGDIAPQESLVLKGPGARVLIDDRPAAHQEKYVSAKDHATGLKRRGAKSASTLCELSLSTFKAQ